MSSLEKTPFKPLSKGSHFLRDKGDKKAKNQEIEYQDVRITPKNMNITLAKELEY